ncbi:hypothetical protein SCHPADRAFT_744045 [Schizopora paradoxa]|uniref:Uncharacterized protein n=1 Tax=Schizopora paradoxa TaxID=27342 RepID=A0A0H2R0R0_9AGAM|nr:hypothetical protein SCHPADRAFT_744045 [Schizopora paradoxa]
MISPDDSHCETYREPTSSSVLCTKQTAIVSVLNLIALVSNTADLQRVSMAMYEPHRPAETSRRRASICAVFWILELAGWGLVFTASTPSSLTLRIDGAQDVSHRHAHADGRLRTRQSPSNSNRELGFAAAGRKLAMARLQIQRVPIARLPSMCVFHIRLVKARRHTFVPSATHPATR